MIARQSMLILFAFVFLCAGASQLAAQAVPRPSGEASGASVKKTKSFDVGAKKARAGAIDPADKTSRAGAIDPAEKKRLGAPATRKNRGSMDDWEHK
jgi:hypothetical protein